VADWFALNYFAMIRSADLFGFLGAPCFWFPVFSVGCVAECLEPFFANHLCWSVVVPSAAVLFDGSMAESCLVLEGNFLKLNLASFVEHLITLFLFAVLVLSYKCIKANLDIFMPALPLFIFLNMVYSFVLCTANSSIIKYFFIWTVIYVDSFAPMFFIIVGKT